MSLNRQRADGRRGGRDRSTTRTTPVRLLVCLAVPCHVSFALPPPLRLPLFASSFVCFYLHSAFFLVSLLFFIYPRPGEYVVQADGRLEAVVPSKRVVVNEGCNSTHTYSASNSDGEVTDRSLRYAKHANRTSQRRQAQGQVQRKRRRVEGHEEAQKRAAAAAAGVQESEQLLLPQKATSTLKAGGSSAFKFDVAFCVGEVLKNGLKGNWFPAPNTSALPAGCMLFDLGNDVVRDRPGMPGVPFVVDGLPVEGLLDPTHPCPTSGVYGGGDGAEGLITYATRAFQNAGE